jgi:ankyrin repeat domain-containing protein 50
MNVLSSCMLCENFAIVPTCHSNIHLQNRFQWAALQIRQLLSLTREASIRERLGKLPKDLKATYEEIFTTIKNQDEGKPDIAVRAFKWVMCSARPLSPRELVVAVCQDPETDGPDEVDADIDIDFIFSACQNLLDLKENGDVVLFAHLSVREYFEEHWGASEADNLVAKVCLSLLNDPDHWEARPPNIPSQSQCLHLLHYARQCWQIHAGRYNSAGPDARVSMLLQNFLGTMNKSGPAYRSWHKMMASDPPSYWFQLRPCSLCVLAMCLFGLYDALLGWWEDGLSNVEQRNDEGQSLLALASQGGSEAIVELLLGSGADVNAVGGTHGNALYTASFCGHVAILELLLSNGADVNTAGGFYGSALQAASVAGNLSAVQLLLDNNADVNAKRGYDWTALIAASAKGHLPVVELLLR